MHIYKEKMERREDVNHKEITIHHGGNDGPALSTTRK